MLMHIRSMTATVVLLAVALALTGLADDRPLAPTKPTAAEATRLVEYPIAILSFRERGAEVKGMGDQTGDLIFAKLAVDPSLTLVDREDLSKTLAEAELNLSGIVNPREAITIGQLTGARLIVTGSVFQIDNSIHAVAKIIGTETSRVIGCSVKGDSADGLDGPAGELGDKIVAAIKKNADSLVIKRIDKGDRIAALKRKLGEAQRPTVFVAVEERHVGRATIDPAAETELIAYCRDTGFTVIDHSEGSPQQAEYVIRGTGISEFAGRQGQLVSVKARLEVKVVDRATSKVVAVDRQTRTSVDLVEQIAAKQALQAAAADIAERILPKLVTPANTP